MARNGNGHGDLLLSAPELIEHLRSVPPIEMIIPPDQAWSLIAAVQLAKRHPQFPRLVDQTLQPLMQDLIRMVANGNERAEATLRAGDDPQYDSTAPEVQKETTAEVFARQLRTRLPIAARDEYREIEEQMLVMAMEACGMTEYPYVVGSPVGERADQSMICEICGKRYGAHPMDWRVIGYGDVPYLNILCDGHRVKL